MLLPHYTILITVYHALYVKSVGQQGRDQIPKGSADGVPVVPELMAHDGCQHDPEVLLTPHVI